MDESSEKLKRYEAGVRHRIQCQERAFHIVNKLIDDAVNESYLMECGQLIGQEHYSDIVEERAISLLCGYPLCGNSLANIPKKKYHISTKSNRVYDIKDRKNFCSNQCYCASKHFQRQISETPTWARANEAPVVFDILDKGRNKGSVGDEIVGWNPRKALEDELLLLHKAPDEKPVKPKPANEGTTETKHNHPVESDKVSNPEHDNFKETKFVGCDSKNDTNMPAIPDSKTHISNNETLNSDNNSSNSNVLNDVDSRIDDPHSSTAVTVSDVSPCVPQLTDQLQKVTLDSTLKESEPLKNIEKMDDLSIISEAHTNNTLNLSCLKSPSSETGATNVSNTPDVAYDKIQHLKNLMAKKKKVLSKMAEVQTVSIDENTSETIKNKSLNTNSDHSEKEMPNVKSKKAKSLPVSPLSVIGNILKRWITPTTVEHLHTSASSNEVEDPPAKFSDPAVQIGYANLCKKLDAKDVEMDNLSVDCDEEGAAGKPAQKKLPNYDVLKAETYAYQLKVTEFLTGKRPKDQIQEKKVKDPEIFLPTVDAYDQQQIRIKIVLDKLDKSMNILLGPLGLTIQDISGRLRELVYTFNLEKDTIVFKPSEWTLVSLYILKMLCLKHCAIQEAFEAESSKKFYSTLLKGIHHSMNDLDDLIKQLVYS